MANQNEFAHTWQQAALYQENKSLSLALRLTSIKAVNISKQQKLRIEC